jgi:hypothetical protein
LSSGGVAADFWSNDFGAPVAHAGAEELFSSSPPRRAREWPLTSLSDETSSSDPGFSSPPLQCSDHLYKSIFCGGDHLHFAFQLFDARGQGKALAFSHRGLLLSLLIALVVVLQAIIISHRAAGPEFRLTRTVRAMAAGQYPHAVTLRKHDHLKELAASVSFLGQELDQRRQVCLEQLVQVDAALDACTMDSRHNVPADVVQAQLEGLRKQICGLKEFVAQGTEPRREEQIPPDLRLDDRFQDRAARSQQW